MLRSVREINPVSSRETLISPKCIGSFCFILLLHWEDHLANDKSNDLNPQSTTDLASFKRLDNLSRSAV